MTLLHHRHTLRFWSYGNCLSFKMETDVLLHLDGQGNYARLLYVTPQCLLGKFCRAHWQWSRSRSVATLWAK